MTTANNPLIASVPVEVPLTHAPLIRVIAQLKFPPIVSIEKNEFIAPFQEALRNEYPVLRPERAVMLALPGTPVPPPRTIWRFGSINNAWRVSLSPEFIALETSTAYVSHSDFLNRLSKVVNALSEHINPQLIDRLGVRYIDRVTGST